MGDAKIFDDLLKRKPKSDQSTNIIDDELPKVLDDTSKNIELMMIQEVVKTLQSKKDIALKTDLSEKEILLFAQAKIMARYYDIKVIDDFIQTILYYKLSRRRKSRSEMVEVISKLIGQSTENRLNSKLMVGDRW